MIIKKARAKVFARAFFVYFIMNLVCLFYYELYLLILLGFMLFISF